MLDLRIVDLKPLRHILESNVRVKDDERAENSIRRGVEGAGSERSDGKRDQTNSDRSI